MVFVGLNQSLGMWALASRWFRVSLLYGALGLGYWLTLLVFAHDVDTLLTIMPVAAALAFAFAIPLFGQSIAQAPGLLVGLLLVSVYMAAGLDRAALRWQFVYFFIAGGIGFYFDLLNGDILAILICFAWVRLLGIAAFGPPRILSPPPLARFPATTTVAHAMLSYVAGAMSMAIFRIVLRATLTHQGLFAVLSEWHQELVKWIPNHVRSLDTHVSVTAPLTTLNHLTADLPHRYHDLDVATFPYISWHATLFIYALCGLLYLAIGIWWLKNRSALRASQHDTLCAACLIASIVPLWCGLFLGHTITHFWMDGRLLALFFSLAPSITLLCATWRSANGHSGGDQLIDNGADAPRPLRPPRSCGARRGSRLTLMHGDI